MDALTDHQEEVIRGKIIDSSKLLIGIPYKREAEWTDYSKQPEALDCSELVEGVYVMNGLKMPDGSWAQFDFTTPCATPKSGDLAFFGKGGNPSKIYHVGIVWGALIIEARELDPYASFETGKVIMRPRLNWENYKNFVGYRIHPKFA